MNINLEQIAEEKLKAETLLKEHEFHWPQGIVGNYRGRIELYKDIINGKYEVKDVKN